MDVKVW